MLKAKKLIFISFCLILGVVVLFAGNTQVFASENLTPNSKSSILMEAQTGQILSEHDSTKTLPIASVTKQMSILVVLDQAQKGLFDLESEVVASENSAKMGGSQVFIDANSTHKAKNLLKAMIVASANDASVAMAEAVSGSEANFVELMNQKSIELGLENTNYQNCTGLPAPSHYSCAKDVAIVLKELLKYPLYFEYSKIWMEDFTHPSGRVTGMANTNKLIKFYSPCDAGKTGSTNEAGFCLSATAKKDDLRLISVVLGANNSKLRFSDAKKQFEWGFANFQSQKLLSQSDNFASQTSLQKAKTTNLIVNPQEDFFAVTQKGEKPNFHTKTNLPKILKAPLKQGDIVGTVDIFENENLIKTTNLVVAEDIQAKGFFDLAKTVFGNW